MGTAANAGQVERPTRARISGRHADEGPLSQQIGCLLPRRAVGRVSFFCHGPQDLVLHGQPADLAFGLLKRPVVGRPVGSLTLQRLLATLEEVVPSSRDSVSSGSPRSNLSIASIFLPADHLGRDR
jgi:hypothetical protein